MPIAARCIPVYKFGSMFYLWESRFWWFAILFHLATVSAAIATGLPIGSLVVWTTVSLAMAYRIAESDALGVITLFQGAGARRDTNPRRFRQSLIASTVMWFLVNGIFTGALYLFSIGELQISAVSIGALSLV